MMSDTITIMMKVTADEKTVNNTRLISSVDEAGAPRFDHIEFEFDLLSAPLKDMLIPLLDNRYDGPVTICVESREGEKVLQNRKTIMNSDLKKMVQNETQSRGLISYGSRQQEFIKRLVDALFDEISRPIKDALKNDIKNQSMN
jgi:hypothetical protein